MSHPMRDLPPEFHALEARLAELQARYNRGNLEINTYQSEVQNLKVEDQSGRTWWLGGESGAWHYWDGRAWIRATPPKIAQPIIGEATPDQSHSRRSLILGCATGTLIVVVLTVIFLITSWRIYLQEPRLVEGAEAEAPALAPYTLTPDQVDVTSHLGNPEAFAIMFYDEEQSDGSTLEIRFESWSYFTAGQEYTFVNGEQIAKDTLDIEPVDSLLQNAYRPEQFVAYMSLNALIASAELDRYLVVPLEKELVDGGEVYYSGGLTFGLKDNQLMYIESLPLESGG
jgi:hypothetical protein